MLLEVLHWIGHVWSSIECVCCACGPGERLDGPSICFVCVLYVGSYLLIYEFESWITDVCSSYVVSGYGGLSESGLCVFRELCPVSFLVVGKVRRLCSSL